MSKYAVQYYKSSACIIDTPPISWDEVVAIMEKFEADAISSLEKGNEIELAVWDGIDVKDGRVINYRTTCYDLDTRDCKVINGRPYRIKEEPIEFNPNTTAKSKPSKRSE